MKRILFLILFCCGCTVAIAQNITVVEYFFDSDPGYGSGTSVAITPAVSITNFTFPIDLSAQSDGFHTLFVRAKDANDNWSIAYSRPFYKLSVAQANPTAPSITKIEYFLDTDPGYGVGVDVPVTPSSSISNFTFAIPLSSTTDGFHTLFVRTQDANNNWGITNSRAFYKISASTFAPVPEVNKLEYFIDADPGYGLGVDVPVTAAISISNIGLTIPLTAIAEGSHVITFRARDANNNWSVVAIKNFSKCNHPGTTVNAATGITSSGFIASWADVPGSIGYRLDVSTDNFSTFVSGYNNKVITAPALSSAVTGLAQATSYQYRVRAVASCTSVESNTVNLTTLATPPSAQPTNLLFSSVTANSLTAFFTAPGTAPTGYLVVRKIGSASAFVPATNTSYTLNQNTGDGVVAYVGPTFLFNETGLTPDTQYFYSVFAYNQVSTSISYLTTSPLQNNVRTVALEPAAQPTNLQFASVTDVGFSVSFTAATGSPTGYLVLRKIGSAPSSTPVDGTTYSTTVGTDAVVHNGPSTAFSQTSLIQNTEYFYSVYAYNGSGTAINYRVISPLQGSQLTPITPPSAAPTNLIFTSVTPSSMTVSYTAATGTPSGYLVVRKAVANPAFVPQSNTSYTQGQILSDGTVAYVGTGLTFNESGLTASTPYYYDVFAYNQNAALFSYQLVAPLEGNKTTFTAEPTAQASALVFSSVTTNSMIVSFTAASPAPTGYLVLRKAGSAPTSSPLDGTAYTVSQPVGDGTVAFTGTATSFTDSGLSPGTTYFYQILSYAGTGTTTNYLTIVSPSNSGSKITIPDKPILNSATSIEQNKFTVSWATVTSAVNYRMDVSKDNFVTKVSGFDDVTEAGTSAVVTGLETGTAYKFHVRAVNGSGTSVNSDELQQFTIPATPALTAATNVTQTGLVVNWTSVTGATGYALDISTLSDFSTFVTNYQDKALGNVTAETVSALTPGITYYYRVRSVNTGGASPNSSVGNQLLFPATPVGSSASTITSSSFKSQWQAVAGVTEYRLDVTLSSDNFSPSLTGYTNVSVGSGVTEYLVSGLSPNTQYKYRIRAVNATGTSPSSTAVEQFTLPTTPILSAATAIGQTGLTINWSSPGGALGYYIDISEKNDFSTFVAGYQNKLLASVNTEVVINLNPGTVYYYRLRSTNAGGTSPSSSPVGSQLLLPATPVGVDATGIQSTSFKAKWLPVAGAVDEYRVDVTLAADNFSPILPGYSNVFVDKTITELPVNATPNTTYRYRIRAVNASGTSPSSAYVAVITPASSSNTLKITDPTPVASFTGSVISPSITIETGTAPYTVTFYYRKITDADFTIRTASLASGTTYQSPVDQTMLDKLGAEFWFKVDDASGQSKPSAHGFIYQAIPTSGEKIPLAKFGGVAESYEIFSIPYQITSDLVGQIFEEMGSIDKSKWRLVRYQGGKNVDLGTASKIEPGKGYWFNRKENIDVSFSGGTVVQQNQTTPFALQLEKGWNQVGNPFPFDVDWNDILAANPTINMIGNLKVFTPENLQISKESNNLKTWSGGFVHNGNDQTVTLSLPVVLKNTAGGRVASGSITNSQLDQPEWHVPITITQGQIFHTTSGIGMHPEASVSIDQYDDIVVPRFLNYLEFYSNHQNYFSPKFSRDIVPTTTSFTWNLNFESNANGDDVTLQWNNQNLGLNTAQLLLYDITNNAIVDMKTTGRYSFKPQANQVFKIFYGINDNEIKPDITTLGKAYPNPFTGDVAIPFMLGKQSDVVVSVSDLMGKPIKQLVRGSYEQGIHQVGWDGLDGSGTPVSAGLYFYKLEVNGQRMTGRIIKK